jgi:hypothetical protein
MTVRQAREFLSRLHDDTEVVIQDQDNRVNHVASIQATPLGGVIVAGKPFHRHDDPAELPAQRIRADPIKVEPRVGGHIP